MARSSSGRSMNLDEILRGMQQLIEQQEEDRGPDPGEGNFECEDCNACYQCRFCVSCNGCEDCTYCEECDDCLTCTQCKRSVSCETCSYVEDCRDCESSRYLALCVSCVDCVHCLGCVGLEGAEFHVLNEKVTRKEFFNALQLVRAAMEARLARGWRPDVIGLESADDEPAWIEEEPPEDAEAADEAQQWLEPERVTGRPDPRASAARPADPQPRGRRTPVPQSTAQPAASAGTASPGEERLDRVRARVERVREEAERSRTQAPSVRAAPSARTDAPDALSSVLQERGDPASETPADTPQAPDAKSSRKEPASREGPGLARAARPARRESNIEPANDAAAAAAAAVASAVPQPLDEVGSRPLVDLFDEELTPPRPRRKSPGLRKGRRPPRRTPTPNPKPEDG